MTDHHRAFLAQIAVDIFLYGAENQTVTDEDAIAAEEYARSLGVEVRMQGKAAGA